MLEHVLERVLAEDEHVVVVTAEPIGAHLQLVGALLAADVENLLLRQAEHGLQRQRTLADAWFTAQQHDAARHEPATQHTVQLFVVHVDARVVVVRYVAEPESLGGG